ncbi:MAG TPA: hypothetical protein VKH83_12375 [Methylomirabilota bacterium]|nr:hypothetical protein [Methylomirabilota bacterium]
MIERAWVGGVLVAIAGVVLPTAAVGAGEGTQQAPMILNLMNRPIESRERAFTEDIKREALAPRPSAVDEWEPQPDGSMRNKKTGISVTVRNPCPPGDIEHEFALAAYNRSKPRR